MENQEQWKCRSCGQGFETKGRRDGHHRRVHQRASLGDGRRSRAEGIRETGEAKFECSCGKKFGYSSSLTRHRRGCYSEIAMIASGGNSSEYEEGIVPGSEDRDVSDIIFSLPQSALLYCLFCYKFANIRTHRYKNGLGGRIYSFSTKGMLYCFAHCYG